MSKLGRVYIIKNKINNKVYVGQTMQSLHDRFQQHVYCSQKDNFNSKIHSAMRELGIHNFYIELIRECDITDLNKYEQLYVEYYDSINNGYNTLYPQHSRKEPLVHDYEDKLIDMYMCNYSYAVIAKNLNISLNHVNDIISKYGLSREYTDSIITNESKPTIIYDLEFNPIAEFNSMIEAYRWLCEYRGITCSTFNFYNYVDVACKNGNIAYQLRWQHLEDLYYDGKVFRSIFDKEAYLHGGTPHKLLGFKNTRYWIVDGALDSIKTMHKKNRCIDCGKEVYRNSIRCDKCNRLSQRVIEYNDNLGNNYEVCNQCGRHVARLNKGLCSSCLQVKIKGKIPKPTKEQLIVDLNNMSKKQIAKKYQRSIGTLYHWLETYGLK